MNKIARYLTVYGIWIVDIALALWLAALSRTAFLTILRLSSIKKSSFELPYQVGFADKLFSIFIGLVWLAFMIFSEAHFRSGINLPDLPKRLALITGQVLLGVFSVDLLLLWLLGSGASMQRWLVLAVELGVGISLVVLAKTRFTAESE